MVLVAIVCAGFAHLNVKNHPIWILAAIVYAGFAHLYAKSHPIMILVAIVCVGFASVCSNYVIWKVQPIFDDSKHHL